MTQDKVEIEMIHSFHGLKLRKAAIDEAQSFRKKTKKGRGSMDYYEFVLYMIENNKSLRDDFYRFHKGIKRNEISIEHIHLYANE